MHAGLAVLLNESESMTINSASELATTLASELVNLIFNGTALEADCRTTAKILTNMARLDAIPIDVAESLMDAYNSVFAVERVLTGMKNGPETSTQSAELGTSFLQTFDHIKNNLAPGSFMPHTIRRGLLATSIRSVVLKNSSEIDSLQFDSTVEAVDLSEEADSEILNFTFSESFGAKMGISLALNEDDIRRNLKEFGR